MLRIKSVSIIKANQEVSTIEFADGFNLIHGPSNTGKSVIVECIDFVFGAKKEINSNFSPKEVKMEISCEIGNITLVRVCGKTSLFVTNTNIPGIQCKEYPQRSINGLSASDIIMKLLGLDEGTMIIKNASWDTQKLTFRTFSDSFIINENNISTGRSILLPDQNVEVTAFKSALLYLLTKDNHIDPSGSPVEKVQRRKVIVPYLSAQIDKLKAKMEKYSDFKKGLSDEVRKDIGICKDEIKNIKSEINKNIDESKKISEELIKTNDLLASDTNFIEKYNDLLSQYESDLIRLEMIVDGKLHESEQEMPKRCPFCNGELQKEEEQSCVEAVEAELLRLYPQIKDLKESRITLENELNDLKIKRDELIQKKKEIDSIVDDNLKPYLEKLEMQLNDYRNAIIAENDYKNDNNLLNDLLAQLEEAKKMPTKAPNYSPDLYLQPLIKHNLENKITEVLTRAGYPLNELSFDIKKLDLIINGHEKANEGEGFRGFFNTIVALSLQNLLIDIGEIKPGLLIIDSPIMSLKETTDNQNIQDKYKKALFECLKEASRNLQIIIIENEKPDIDYRNCKVTEFTKKTNIGRYGFVKNYED